MLTLKHLRYFEALSRLRHFGQAAGECAVSQPALSMQIQEMEDRLGAPLVERRRGDMKLTPLGEEVARRARGVLTAVRDIEDYARQTGGVLTGSLALGVIPSIAPYLLPAVLPRLRERHPQLDLLLRETQTANLISELAAGQLDAVLLALPIDAPDLATLPLFEDEFVLASPATAPLPGGAALRPDVIPSDQLLLLEEGHCFRDQALAVCSGEYEMRGRFGATSLATLVQLVANGYGVTLLPEMAVSVEVEDDPRIEVHAFAAPRPSRTVGLAWRRSSPRAADFTALGEIIRDVWTSRARN